MTPERRCYALLSILQSHAPDRQAQALCTEIYNRMGADGLTYPDQEKQLAAAFIDGLSYGNWPWVITPGDTYLSATIDNIKAEQQVQTN